MSRNPVPLITLLCLFSIIAAGQKNDYRILLRGSSIAPAKNISSFDAENFNRRAARINDKTFTIIQFERIPTIQERAMLLQAGIVLLDYIPNNAYTASVKGQLNAGVLNAVKARAILDLRPEQKMFPALADKRFPARAIRLPGTIDVWVSFAKTFSFDVVSRELRAHNFDILADDYKNYRVISLRIAQQKINELAALPFIEFVQAAPGEDKPLNNKDVVNAKANVLSSLLGRGLDGKGVAIGIGDNADPLNHIDFNGRLINRAALVGQSHGVHVMGTAAGAGIVNEKYKGFAPKATIIGQAFSGILASAPAYVTDYGMVVTNNSYANVTDDCETFGIYDLYSRILDQYAYDMPYLENVFASGNSGAINCSPYLNGFSNVVGGYQTAKNVITVGATSELGLVASFSSKGPVRDGRIKPEIVTQGQPVISTIPFNSYGSNQGTSMASPGAAGGITLLYQRYRQLHPGTNPKNALIKALVCNGATDLGNVGPDFSYGFGWMNLLRSVNMMEHTNYFNDSVANTVLNIHTITIPANIAQLKVMLYWNDPAAAVLAAHALVNDLDLEVVDPASGVNLPFILDTVPGNVTSVATTGVDHINNIEQVVINNPAAGTYNLRVTGTAITQNPRQEYFLVYDTLTVSTTITYPVGGEVLTAGDFQYVTWESYGNTSNNFTIEYTLDGTTWNPVTPGTAAAGDRQLGWTIPAVFSDMAQVRITKNGTGEVSTSQKFTIVGIPAVSLASVQCEGYIAINWTAVTEATGYEVMMLRGDEMVHVATVPAAQTNYTFSGLSKDSVYWVTVRSLLNSNFGRRANAIASQPNTGTCAGTISDNDLKIDAVTAPVSGRVLTSTTLSAATTISARVKNLDDATINSFELSYSINGGSFTAPEPNGTPVAANSTYTHNFSTPVDFSVPGAYQLRIAVHNLSAIDPVTANDTLLVIIKQLANPAVLLTVGSDFLDDMETADSATYYSAQSGLGNRDRYDFVSNSVNGRLRTFVNSGIAYSGDKALTLDADRFNAGTTDSLTGTFNLAAYDTATDDLRLDFQFKHHGQVPNAANNVWIRGSDQKPWISIYDLYANQGDPGLFNKTSSLELTDILHSNNQNYSSSFQVRWGQWGQILTADNETAAGYTFDDIHLYKVSNDIQMIRIDTPVVSSCGLGSAVPVRVMVRNTSKTAITGIPVHFQADGGVIINETVTAVNGNDSILYTFTAVADLSLPGAHTVKAWVAYPSDSYPDNDTASVNLYNSPVIASFPYLQNFEADNGLWYTNGKKSSWQYGTPASQKINRAASGSKAWKTALVGNYNDLEQSYLYSPCFDIASMVTPTLSFSVALDLEDCGAGSLCDAAYIEYSADGNTWTRLGGYGQGTNWYNKNFTGNNANVWSIQDYTRWHVATIPLPTGMNRLRLRFILSSDPYTSHEGIAVDDIHIYDNTMGIYTGATMGAPVSQSIAGGTAWVDFTSGGKLVASVMPNNQSMGATAVQAYINTGAVRTSSNQYYHDRNITIKPATVNLADSATVRFYFLDTETETLINATGCGSCSKPSMAYELGVSKYRDLVVSNENGTLTDNVMGDWQYIIPAEVAKVPFDIGYYAEFKVKNFSEFWLNNGGPDNMHVLPVKLEKFSAVKKAADVLVEWTTAEEVNTDRYEIEIAKGYSDYQQNKFIKSGVVYSRNSVSEQQYTFTDAEKNKSGVRYYRLRIIDKDGKYVYSDVRPVLFNGEINWQVYPNPSDGQYSFVYQLNAGATMTVKVYDINARLVKEVTVAADGFVQKQSLDLRSPRYAPGLYLIEASAGEKKQLFKVIKQ